MICQFCSTSELKAKYSVKSEISGTMVLYYRCSHCGSLTQYPAPDPGVIKNYYESYFEIKNKMNPGYLEADQYLSLKNERNKTFSEIGFPLSSIKNKRNVELGCANGHFLRYLAENGSKQTTGIDISDTLLSSINLENVQLINGGLKDIGNEEADNLFMFNVIEHIDVLAETFRHIERITHKGSYIIIETPVAGIVSSIHGRSWRFLMADEHLNIPTMDGFYALFAEYGLQVKGFTRFGSGLTAGTIHPFIKKNCDLFVKKLRLGDRGTFLLERK